MMGRFHALILAIEAVFMLPALIICLVDGNQKTASAFTLSIAATALVAALIAVISRGAKRDFYAREGLICVGSSWIVISLFGCLPFLLSGEIPRFIDALFEMVSGFTTTGASIVANVEGLSRGSGRWQGRRPLPAGCCAPAARCTTGHRAPPGRTGRSPPEWRRRPARAASAGRGTR